MSNSFSVPFSFPSIPSFPSALVPLSFPSYLVIPYFKFPSAFLCTFLSISPSPLPIYIPSSSPIPLLFTSYFVIPLLSIFFPPFSVPSFLSLRPILSLFLPPACSHVLFSFSHPSPFPIPTHVSLSFSIYLPFPFLSLPFLCI
jgi:hypothetical protein